MLSKVSNVFVSRKEYNQLVEMFPDWMRHEWPKLQRDWQIGGVFIKFAPPQLRVMLSTLAVLGEKK